MSKFVISFTEEDFAREIQFTMGPRFVLTPEKLEGFIKDFMVHVEHCKPFILYSLTDIEDRISLYFMEEYRKTEEEGDSEFLHSVGCRCTECPSFNYNNNVFLCEENHLEIDDDHICPLGK